MTTLGDVLQAQIEALQAKKTQVAAERNRIQEDIRMLVEESREKEREALNIDEAISLMKELKFSPTRTRIVDSEKNQCKQMCKHCTHWKDASDRCCHCLECRQVEVCPAGENNAGHCQCHREESGPCCLCKTAVGE